MRTRQRTRAHRRRWVASIVVPLALALAMTSCTSNESSSNGNVGGSGSGPGEGAKKVDACALVTAQDAATVFGRAAKEDTGSGVVVDAAFLGECHWTYEQTDPSTGAIASENVSFYVWQGAKYYSKSPGAADLAIGDGGSIKVDKTAGVEIEWVQHDTTFVLSYFTIGLGIDPSTKAEAMKSLATSVSAKLGPL